MGVRELTTEEISDRARHHFDNTEDLIYYSGLNVQMLDLLSIFNGQTK